MEIFMYYGLPLSSIHVMIYKYSCPIGVYTTVKMRGGMAN